MDLIKDINLNFFKRNIDEKQIEHLLEKENRPESGIFYGVQRDKTLSLRSDLMDKLSKTPVRLRRKEKRDNKYDTTMRFKRDPETGEPVIRIPPSYRRSPLFENDKIVPENQAGHLVLLEKFIVCEFKYADMVLEHSGCKQETIKRRKQRFSDIYNGISADEFISIFLIDHFVDEKYWFSYINSRKSA